jgi:hypothetical protein
MRMVNIWKVFVYGTRELGYIDLVWIILSVIRLLEELQHMLQAVCQIHYTYCSIRKVPRFRSVL